MAALYTTRGGACLPFPFPSHRLSAQADVPSLLQPLTRRRRSSETPSSVARPRTSWDTLGHAPSLIICLTQFPVDPPRCSVAAL